jgi:plastocyanin
MTKRQSWYIEGVALFFILALAATGFIVAGMHGAFKAKSTAPQSSVSFGVTQVSMVNDVFTPARIHLTLGTSVIWTNHDSVPHNVTISPVVITSSNSWDSGLNYPGQSYTYTFTSRGTFYYRCQEHPSMTGTVIVT